MAKKPLESRTKRFGLSGFDIYQTNMPIYDFGLGGWRINEKDEIDSIIYRRNLLGAMHPNVNCAIGAIPPNKSPDEAFISKYSVAMKKGIELPSESGSIQLKLDLAGSSRTHGHYVFTDAELGKLYFGEAAMNRINYGSILLTECKKLISRKIRVVIIDEEEDRDIIVPTIPEEALANYPGDSHGKISAELAQELTEGVDDSWATEKKPIQIRVGIPNQYCWKGTVTTVKGGLPKVVDPDDSAFTVAEAQEYDLLLPLSGFKGKKPSSGEVFTEVIFVGTVALGEQRVAKGSQMLWAWYSWDAVEGDIIPRTLTECQALVEAFDSPKAMAEILGNEYRNKLDFDFSGSLGEEEDIEDGEGAEAGADEQFEDPLVTILSSDKAGLLLRHPWVVGRMTDRLAKRWKRLAIAGAVEFVSLLGQPIPMTGNNFMAKDVSAGEHLLFRNPILHYGYINILNNIIDNADDHQLGATKNIKGAIWMDQQLMLERFQGDTDGDWYQAKEREYDGIEYDDENITWETKNFETIYGTPPEVEKLGKEAIPGEIEIVAIRSMDNQTGVISNLIQNAKANGTIHKKVNIDNFNYRTGEYTGGSTQMTVIAFLSQAMQNEVDRLKNNIHTHKQGITACRNAIFTGTKQAPWLVDRAYKKDWIYKTAPIPTTHEDGSQATDTVSRMIAAVNEVWQPYDINKKHVGDFENLFPNHRDRPQPYDEFMLDWAQSINRWYGATMAKAANLGENDTYWVGSEGSEAQAAIEEFKKERIKQMRNIREEARDYWRRIDKRLEVTKQNIDRLKEKLNVTTLWDIPFNELPGNYQKFFRQAFDEQPVTLIVDNTDWDIMGPNNTNYRLLTRYDWAAAFWHASHHWGASDETTGGLVFLLFADEITTYTRTGRMNTLTVYGVQHSRLAPLAWGDYDAVPIKGANKVHAIKATKEGNPYQLYYPSSKLYEKFPDIKRHLCNVVQMYTDSREAPATIMIRSSPEKDWTIFGDVGRGEVNLPEPGELCAAKIYSWKIGFFKDEPKNKYRTTQATILWYYIRPEDWPLDNF
ncbi:MAG: hypothetical protein AAGJ08_13790 [Cyanobacteria bacterium P01_H01_bin.35]